MGGNFGANVKPSQLHEYTNCADEKKSQIYLGQCLTVDGSTLIISFRLCSYRKSSAMVNIELECNIPYHIIQFTG